MIRVKSFTKSYHNLKAVDDLSFTVNGGEILGLLGPNGAGKTTTLRTLAGILRPNQGEIFVADRNIQKEPVEAKRDIAYLPDNPSFFDTLTCWEHMRFTAEVYQVKDFPEYSEKLFRRFDLWEKRDALCSELSKGMKQRVAICCALLHRPKVLLFDEPMTGLDPRGIRTLNDVLKEQAASGVAIVLSSHLLSILQEVCTKVLVMIQGRSRLYGTIDEVRSKRRELSDASLEEMFFYATEREDSDAA